MIYDLRCDNIYFPGFLPSFVTICYTVCRVSGFQCISSIKTNNFGWFCLTFSTTCWSQGNTYITTVLMATLSRCRTFGVEHWQLGAKRPPWDGGMKSRCSIDGHWLSTETQGKDMNKANFHDFLKFTPEFRENSLGKNTGLRRAVTWVGDRYKFSWAHALWKPWKIWRGFQDISYSISKYIQYHSMFVNELNTFDFRFHPTTARCHLKRKWTL